MEFRNTPPPPPIPDQDDASLVEFLCLELRDVGVCNAELPDGEKVRERIFSVKEISTELSRRGVDPSPRIRQLSGETSWDMEALLRDTLAFPEAVPYLASTPDPRCGRCGIRISRGAILALCPRCVAEGLQQLAEGKGESHLNTCPICGRQERGFLVYADALVWMNYCRHCLEEQETRYSAA